MGSIERRAFLLAGLGLPAAAGLAVAEPAERERSLFERVVQRRTGTNGYEELVMAADLLRTSQRYQEAEGLMGKPGGLPLRTKREVLADPPVLRAQALMERGLAKAVRSPRPPEKMNIDTLFPEYAAFRQMARLLAMREYVQLADGQVPAALDTARTLLRLGRAVQQDILLSGLVGIAISTIGIRTLGGYLDQLSLPDCQQLFAVCAEWLRQPEPMRQVLDGERFYLRNALAEMQRLGPEQMREWIGTPEGEESDPETGRLLQEFERLHANPAVRDTFFAQVWNRMNRYFDHALTETRKPWWERQMEQPLQGDRSLPGVLVGILTPTLDGVNDAYAREAALVQQLACHAAILRYRWETEQLPESIAALKLGQLALDPFTGQPLNYEVAGGTYRLTSVGPIAPPDAPDAVDGRRPVSVVPTN